MSQFNLLESPLISKIHASWLYRRGMMYAKLSNNALAIADYTRVIEMAHAPSSIRAMALYNRALVHCATSCEVQAVEELQKVLEMPGATEQVRTEARRKLVRMQRSSNRSDSRNPRDAANPEEGVREKNSPDSST